MKKYKKQDALNLERAHRELSQKLSMAENLGPLLKDAVRKTAEKIVKDRLTYILEDIPAEEVNRGKNGIKVKSLIDAGYKTLADLDNTDTDTLTAINGISPQGAVQIRSILERIKANALKGIKIDLSGEKTEDLTYLVKSLYAMMGIFPCIDECFNIHTAHDGEISSLIMDINPIRSGFKWMFSSKGTKEKVYSSCERLENLLNGEYGQKAQALIKKIDAFRNALPEEAFADMETYPIKYALLFDEICPGLRGKEDNVYGLPEKLAEEIEKESPELQGLNCKLRRYQEWGVKYILKQKRVLLGDEMGLGKTVQAIAAMVSLFNTGKKSFMVVAPAGVLANWCREIKKFCNIPVIKVHGDDKEEAVRKWAEEGGIAVTTYETTGFIISKAVPQLDMLIVDEAHYIKNPLAQRTKNVKYICTYAENILFMTGTAMENKVDEMIGLMQILNPGVALEAKKIASLSSAPQFRDTIAPVYYRRRREDVLKELPELIENEDWCELTPREMAIYENDVVSRSFADARRVSWNVDDLSLSSKAQRLAEIVEDARDDERKVIVFSFFLDTIRKVCEMFPESCTEPITGAVAPQRRQEIVDEFTSAPSGTILPAQIVSGGTGLNIQSASVVVICEPQFKPSLETQAIGRAYRMGQKRTVLVHRLLCEDTVDEEITRLLQKKQKDFDAFADESSAAQEALEMDNSSFALIMEEEAKRIEAKNSSTENKEKVENKENNI